MNNVVYYLIIEKEENINQTKNARDILKEMLKTLNIEPCEIAISEYGKPYFINSNVKFNYSHSKKYIACAISNYEIGIDIEQVDRKISNNLSTKYLNGTKDITIWVKKESYSKMIGKGIGLGLDKLDIDNVENTCKIMKTDKYICCIYVDTKEDMQFIPLQIV